MKKLIKFLSRFLSDKFFIKLKYFCVFKKRINLKNPQTLNEKLNWLKLYDRNEIYPIIVDKYEAKKFVSEIIGEEYIIPTLGIYDNFDEIDFSKLPDQFVIKTTHDSGTVIIVKNKEELDYNNIKKRINNSLKHNYYYNYREWAYKNVKPRIIIEKLISDGNSDLDDYKFQTFNGKIDSIFVCRDRYTESGVKYYYFDTDWNYLPYSSCVDETSINVPRPLKLDEMINITEKIAQKFNIIRVDLYYVNNKIYFGELTLATNAGFDTTITKEADYIMGSKIDINNIIEKGECNVK